MSYTESEAYQQEIADQYKERNLEMPTTEVTKIMASLGFDVSPEETQEAEAGNMNATFLTDSYVIKISNSSTKTAYSANTIVSEQLPDMKVVRVLKHDIREYTDYEVLVMERAPGEAWLPHMPTMTEEENKRLFAEVLEVTKVSNKINATEKFGWLTDILDDEDNNGFDTYREQLEARLEAYIPKIQLQEDLDQAAISEIITYVEARLHLFDSATPNFVHTDLHMGNVMQQNGKLTAVIDWDSVQSVPSYAGLISLTGLIDNPGQFVEGTPDYPAYKGKQFEYLYPELNQAYADELEDKQLAEKLNVMGVVEALMWMSEDWSREWNKEMVTNLSTKETPKDGDVSGTHFGKIVQKISREMGSVTIYADGKFTAEVVRPQSYLKLPSGK